MKRFWLKKNKPNHKTPFLIQEGNILNESIEEISRKRWVEEVWIPDDEKKNGLSEFIGVSTQTNKIKIIGFFIFLLMSVIFLRNGYLQIWQGDELRAKAENNRLRIKPIVAERGIIYDRNLTPLVTNVPSFNLVLNPQDLPTNNKELKNILEKISNLSEINIDELENKLKSSSGYFFQSINLIENVNYEKAMRLILAGADIPGLNVESVYSRFYLYSSKNDSQGVFLEEKKATFSLSHILGYMGKISKEELQTRPNYLLTDYIGKIGLEKKFEEELRGVYGQKALEVDAFGKEKNIVKILPPQSGKDIILSLDLEYQIKLEEILSNHLKKINKKKASAILMDPNNGEILALINLPSYDNNLFATGISNEEYQKLINDENKPLFPRAWSGLYPAGSTIKPLFVVAALNEKIIDRSTSFLSSGGIQIDRWFFPDWKYGGHGLTDARKAIAETVNTFFYLIGGGYGNFTGMGLEKLIYYLDKFNFGSQLGLDLPGEANGFLPSREWKMSVKKEPWFIGDTYNLSIGQGDLLVTPLQITSLTAVIANGGTLYQPHFVTSMTNIADDSLTEIKVKKIQENIISDNYLKVAREGMRQAVTDGSARMLFDLSIKVAGKTGTAQWSRNADNHAWFTSFAPYENPQLVLTILVEEGGEGSSVAVPIARDFFDWYSKNLR